MGGKVGCLLYEEDPTGQDKMMTLERLKTVMGKEDLEDEEKMKIYEETIKNYIANEYSSVGDLSQHPITNKVKEIEVGVGRVSWVEPQGEGYRTPLVYDKVADREKVEE